MGSNYTKYEGWEVKAVSQNRYKPEEGWFPFAISSSGKLVDYIWLRKEKITTIEYDSEGNVIE